MLQPQVSPHLVADLADAVGKAVNLRHAYESIIHELFLRVGTRAVILERCGPVWMPIAGGADGDQPAPPAAEGLALGGVRVVRLQGPGDSLATAVSLSTTDEDRAAVLLLNGDWSGAQDALSMWSLVLTYALESVRAREVTRRAEGLLVRGYSMARRLSRLGDVDRVSHRIVTHVAQMLDAERVSLALYRKADSCLMIAATHGHSLASVEDVRIKPGEWVIGHVYASNRPVFVRDIRLLSPAARTTDRYRTFSFAAVPMIAGSETVGVLTVTDKRDGSAFGRQDEMALRAIGVWAGTALATARMETEAARLAYAATVDSITGLLNRPYLDSRLHQEIERAKRDGHSLSVLLADIDDFKAINDTWGHQVGDAVLQSVGAVIRSAVRVFDVCARYGGDEFAIVMPNSDRASALAGAERIRRRLLERRDAADAKLPGLTISIGVAVMEPDDSAADLILRADQAMYQAKADGKNLVRAQAFRPASVRATTSEPAPQSRPLVTPAAVDVEPHDHKPPPMDLPYVLVADAHQERAAFCLESVVRFQLGLLIARDADQALKLIERFGPPVLLIVDLALSAKGGFGVIEAVRRDGRRQSEVIAWAASREMREYAAARLTGLKARVISDAAPRSTIRAVIERSLEPPATALVEESQDASAECEDLREPMADLLNRARQACGTPGVGVYMRSHGESRYHATFSWVSAEPMPHSPHHLPHAFERITQTGEVILPRDLGAADRDPSPAGGSPDAVRGLAGVPIISHGEVLGAICVFDSKPLRIDERSLAALKMLGQVTVGSPLMVLPGTAVAPFRGRAEDRELAAAGREEMVALPPVVDWPPSMLERSGGEFAVARELARARRDGHQLSVVLFDFSPADQSAPGADDTTLENVTDTLLRTIRQSDLPIRWSGSELLVVLPGLVDEQARTVAERVRAALHAGARHRVAISGGVAQLKADERFGDVVERARQKVSIAVGRGHNRVI